MSQRDVEPLVPARVLRVANHARARHGGLRDRDSDVRVAGDDFSVVAAGGAAAVGGGCFGGVGGVEFDGIAGGDAAADALGEDVHVRQASGLDDFEVEVAVEVDVAIAVTGLRHGRRKQSREREREGRVPVRRSVEFHYVCTGEEERTEGGGFKVLSSFLFCF